jgi:hypothetical protein
MSPVRSALLGRLGTASAGEATPKTPALLDFKVCHSTQDDAASRQAMDRGQYLARQDLWDVLAREIRDADAARDKTPGGLPLSELLAFGARSDVVNGVEHALFEGHRDASAPLIDGINELEAMRREFDDDPMLSVVVALAHIDLGWAWRGVTARGAVEQVPMQTCHAHFERATALLETAKDKFEGSPFVAAAKCSLLAGHAQPNHKIADEYAALIDLDPLNYRAMRAMGNHLLPRWFGSYRELELEARRTAARTEKIWGAGAYVWVQFDAIAIDDVACGLVDVEFFNDGLRDIVARRPDQEMINLLAAYCGVALRTGYGSSPESDKPREEIAASAQWLVREHLREVHPMVWAHAADRFDNAKRVSSVSRFAARGRETAKRTLEDLFYDERSRGVEITFADEGAVTDPV